MEEKFKLIFGGGGHGRALAEVMAFDVRCSIAVREVFDDRSEFNDSMFANRLEIVDFAKSNQLEMFLGIGDNASRADIHLFFESEGIRFPNVLHRSASVSPTSEICSGSVVFPQCVIGARVKVGVGSICNSGAIVEHDTEIGQFCHVAPNATVCGGVRMGDRVLVGAGAVICPSVFLGSGCFVEAGAIVSRDLSPGERVKR